ncbi:ABC-type transport auxiliary lipoprotein family protein [Sulfurospirillum arcachonense]|uniref:ABC-type transport auxiliary lipoprotein family protein n=1 Tax=Sulfurospirillum arcachonense TaxID=57666 RepID=UPI000468BD7A|nr:ABC-type transport auxiliary lipoprotein family protein [Sulfurospirillum arcachonense]
MKYIWSLLVLLLAFSGCSMKEVTKRADNYRLEPKNSLHVNDKSVDKVLRVQRVEGDSAVMTRAILYKKDGALKPYKYGRWSELLSTRLQEVFTEAIESQNIFKATVSSRSFAIADLILESNLENFEELYSADKSAVHVKIRFRLIERKRAKVLGSILINKVVQVEDRGASGVVKAFNKATQEVVKDLSRWLNELSY